MKPLFECEMMDCSKKDRYHHVLVCNETCLYDLYNAGIAVDPRDKKGPHVFHLCHESLEVFDRETDPCGLCERFQTDKWVQWQDDDDGKRYSYCRMCIPESAMEAELLQLCGGDEQVYKDCIKGKTMVHYMEKFLYNETLYFFTIPTGTVSIKELWKRAATQKTEQVSRELAKKQTEKQERYERNVERLRGVFRLQSRDTIDQIIERCLHGKYKEVPVFKRRARDRTLLWLLKHSKKL